MLDQVPIFLLQLPDLGNALLQLAKRQLKIGGHLIERPRKPFDFIAGLQLHPLVQPTASDLLNPLMENTNRFRNPASDDDSDAAQSHQHHDTEQKNFGDQCTKGGECFGWILTDHRHPPFLAKTSRRQEIGKPDRGYPDQRILVAVPIVGRDEPSRFPCDNGVKEFGIDRMGFRREKRTNDDTTICRDQHGMSGRTEGLLRDRLEERISP